MTSSTTSSLLPVATPLIVGLGEILWDLLPTGRLLGGAPANFAFHAKQLGNDAAALSRVGADELGREILDRVGALGLPRNLVQVDSALPTGTVNVDLADGQPQYTIVEGVAWDRMEWTPDWRTLAARTRAVCFGSLAQRDPVSRGTIHAFLDACPQDAVRIFDINLRQHFHSPEIISAGLRRSQIAKLNDEELPRVIEMLGLAGGDELSMSRTILEAFDLKMGCLTRGAKGSLLVAPNESNEHPGHKVTVSDTIGSGDAFVAAVAHHYLRGASLERINEAANRLGAFVASRSGATPKLPSEILGAVR